MALQWFCSALFTSAVLLGACASEPGGDTDAPSVAGGGRVAVEAGARNGSSGDSTSAWGGTANTSAGGDAAAAGRSGPTAGTSSSMAGSAGNTQATGGSSAEVCGSAGKSAGFEQECLACARDSCEACLCSDCSEQLEACSATPGCVEIAACTRQSGCSGITCYCGDFDAAACIQGQANGPCKSVILAAPGARVPTLVIPSAGPASDAAVAISSACLQSGQPCALDCSSK